MKVSWPVANASAGSYIHGPHSKHHGMCMHVGLDLHACPCLVLNIWTASVQEQCARVATAR